MKKILLSTTVLLAFAAATPAAAQTKAQAAETTDQPIELKLGGFMTWYGTYANQQRTTLVTNRGVPTAIGQYNNVDLIGNAEIYFSGSATLSNDMKIGVMVQLEAGTDSDTSDHVVDETYMTLDTKAGRFIAGNVKNVSNQMAVVAPDASTLGLQETDFRRVIMAPAGFSYNKASYAVLDDISTKISYITPMMNGFTLGVSLMPGNKVKGKDADNLLIPNDGVKLFKNGFDAVALYQYDFGSFNVAASGSYTIYKPNMRANGNTAQEKNINEYGGGLNINAGNLTVGGSYHYVNMSRDVAEFMNPFANIANGSSWDFGVTYAAGPYEFGLSYFQSRADSLTDDGKDNFTLYEASVKYKIISGVEAFIDMGYLDFNSASSNRGLSNKGFATAVGMNLYF